MMDKVKTHGTSVVGEQGSSQGVRSSWLSSLLLVALVIGSGLFVAFVAFALMNVIPELWLYIGLGVFAVVVVIVSVVRGITKVLNHYVQQGIDSIRPFY